MFNLDLQRSSPGISVTFSQEPEAQPYALKVASDGLQKELRAVDLVRRVPTWALACWRAIWATATASGPKLGPYKEALWGARLLRCAAGGWRSGLSPQFSGRRSSRGSAWHGGRGFSGAVRLYVQVQARERRGIGSSRASGLALKGFTESKAPVFLSLEVSPLPCRCPCDPRATPHHCWNLWPLLWGLIRSCSTNLVVNYLLININN